MILNSRFSTCIKRNPFGGRGLKWGWEAREKRVFAELISEMRQDSIGVLPLTDRARIPARHRGHGNFVRLTSWLIFLCFLSLSLSSPRTLITTANIQGALPSRSRAPLFVCISASNMHKDPCGRAKGAWPVLT